MRTYYWWNFKMQLDDLNYSYQYLGQKKKCYRSLIWLVYLFIILLVCNKIKSIINFKKSFSNLMNLQVKTHNYSIRKLCIISPSRWSLSWFLRPAALCRLHARALVLHRTSFSRSIKRSLVFHFPITTEILSSRIPKPKSIKDEIHSCPFCRRFSRSQYHSVQARCSKQLRGPARYSSWARQPHSRNVVQRLSFHCQMDRQAQRHGWQARQGVQQMRRAIHRMDPKATTSWWIRSCSRIRSWRSTFKEGQSQSDGSDPNRRQANQIEKPWRLHSKPNACPSRANCRTNGRRRRNWTVRPIRLNPF